VRTTDIPAAGTDLRDAVDSILSPEVSGETVTEEETLEETTEEETAQQNSEETEAELETEETEEEESEEETESEEAEDDEQHEDDDQDSETGSADLHTITVDGEEVQVDLNELKRGYSGQQYVQKGMKVAAEARKQAEEVYGQLQNERQRIGQVLQMIETGQLSNPPVEPDKAVFEQDPIGYMEARIQYDESLAQYQQQMGTLRHYAEQQTAADQQAREAYLREQVEQLKVADPEFADPDKAQTIRRKMVEGGEAHYGYSPEEIGAITDSRAVLVLRDALRFRELQANAPKAKKRVTKGVAKNKGKRKKPTNAQVQRRKQRSRLKESGKLDDALGLIMETG
jgi:hypothetical protein